MSARKSKEKASNSGRIAAALILFLVILGFVFLIKLALNPVFTDIQSTLSDFGFAWLPVEIVFSTLSWVVMLYQFRDSDSLVTNIGEEIIRRLRYVVIERLGDIQKEQHEMHRKVNGLHAGQQTIHKSQAEGFARLEKRIMEMVPSELKHPDRASDLLQFLYTVRLNILRSRIARLKEMGKSPKVWIDFTRLEWLKEQMESDKMDYLEVLLAYDRMLLAMFQLYGEDEKGIRKIAAELSRLLSDARQSYIQVHECDNCGEGFVGKYYDSEPGFKETDYYWCAKCKMNSKVGDLIHHDSEDLEALRGHFPGEYSKHMEWISDNDQIEQFRSGIWMKSPAVISPGALIIIRDPQEMVEQAQMFLLLPLDVNNLSDVEWNDYVQRHREFLVTDKGLDAVRAKVETGVFGICKKCGVPMLPYSSEYKVYRSSLYAKCPCCSNLKELYPSVDGVVYSYVFFIDPIQNLAWVKALTKKCP